VITIELKAECCLAKVMEIAIVALVKNRNNCEPTALKQSLE
jgi:hypothetical protein